MKKITNTAHCFWYAPGGLPYLRFISIASFALMNPTILFKIYTLDKPLLTGGAFRTHEQSTVHVSPD